MAAADALAPPAALVFLPGPNEAARGAVLRLRVSARDAAGRGFHNCSALRDSLRWGVADAGVLAADVAAWRGKAEAAEAAEQGLSKRGEHPKLLVLLGRCLLRTGHGATAAEKWERAVRLDPDDRAAVGLLKAYRRGVGSNGSVGAMQEAGR